MPISNAASQVATNALQAIPFSSMIGGPLKACIEAQAMAAKTTWDFIQEVGLNTNPDTGEKSAVNVSFSFMQGGRMVQLNVPLLTIVPIPYIAIHSIDINFKANISASSSSVSENTESTTMGGSADINAGIKVGPFHMDAKLNANYSSKKDSKATEESKYSVEYTMDIAVKAGQDSMPAGLAKVLELLGNSLDVSDPAGTLEVNANQLTAVAATSGDTPVAELTAAYKNGEGLFAPEDIKVYGTTDGKVNNDPLAAGEVTGDNIVYSLPVGVYSVKAGDKTVKVTVA